MPRHGDDVGFVCLALSANVTETPAALEFDVESDRGMQDDKSDGETDRGPECQLLASRPPEVLGPGFERAR